MEQGVLAKVTDKAEVDQQRRNFAEGDIVLLKDNSVCRNKWPMAKVLAVHQDDQGHCRVKVLNH